MVGVRARARSAVSLSQGERARVGLTACEKGAFRKLRGPRERHIAMMIFRSVPRGEKVSRVTNEYRFCRLDFEVSRFVWVNRELDVIVSDRDIYVTPVYVYK